MRIVEIREQTLPIASSIRNAYIDFSKMTLSLVAVITDVVKDGKPVNTNHPAFVYGHLTTYGPRILALVGKESAAEAAPAGFDALFKAGVEC